MKYPSEVANERMDKAIFKLKMVLFVIGLIVAGEAFGIGGVVVFVILVALRG